MGRNLRDILHILHPEEIDSAVGAARGEDVPRFKMVDAFVSMLSHDLRNPLSSIHLSAALLLQDIPTGPEGVKARHRVAAIQRSVATMMRMIGTLLDVNLINTGRLPIKPELVDAADDVLEVIDEFMPIASHKNRILDARIPDRPLWVVHDKDRIRQVLGNLVANALRHSPPGSTIQIIAEKLPEDPAWIRFKVCNEGAVVPEGERSRIFERYVQSSDQVSDLRNDPNSVGLGLWIAHWLISEHQGKIWVEPTEEKNGNAFCFMYPRHIPTDH